MVKQAAGVPGLGKIDRKSAVPLHAQIDTILRALIKQPRYVEGDFVPDELTLAQALGVSRGTIRAGMAKLIQEGLIERRAGKGTRVVVRAFHSGIAGWHSLTKEMAAQDIVVENFELAVDFVPASAEVAAALQIAPETSVWRVRRVRGWQGERITLTISWVHPRLGLTGDEDFNQPLNEVLQNVSGIAPERSHEEFAACLANDLAPDLDIEPSAPLLSRKRITYDAREEPIEFNLNWYRPERHRLLIDLHRKE